MTSSPIAIEEKSAAKVGAQGALAVLLEAVADVRRQRGRSLKIGRTECLLEGERTRLLRRNLSKEICASNVRNRI